MEFRKIIFSLTIVAGGVIAISIFWEQPFLLSSILVTLAFLKHKVFPIKQEVVWFIISGVLGSTVESIIIFSGAWSYAGPQLINIPVWLPFLWGLAGITGVTLYAGISESNVVGKGNLG